MAKKTGAETISVHVRNALRQDILDGLWEPGSRLQLGALSTRYETSSTVVREALTRLVGDRLVHLHPNRGFFVADLSYSEISDVIEMKCANESLGINLAITRGSIDWESSLMAALHRLERTPQRQDQNAGTTCSEWNYAHQSFHTALIEACNVPLLVDLTKALSDLVYLYERWAPTTPPSHARDIDQEHRGLLHATIERDAERATRLLQAHYRADLSCFSVGSDTTSPRRDP